jgi:RNA polymerase sigma factor (sigma-70 family)
LAAAATEAADDQLVAAVREGSDEAFEALYRRYRPRIVAYVRSMCGDHARAEDVTQEAFMSALRGLRSCDKEIVFRPWVYEIAKNACIDHIRRAGRSGEVSIDSEDFSPVEEGRISESVSGTDAEVTRRRELESLQMAFGDLPESQHRILVMRELEGLSYERIGSRMGLSRGAVESLLFRARRTVRDGFDDIDTGERCHRMRIAMEAVADGRRAGVRERRRLTTHLRQCAGCRRTAIAVGLDELALEAARERGRALRRVAALFPLPAFLRRRLDDGVGLLNAMGPAADQGASLTAKAAAVVVAAALAAGGAGIATKASGGSLGVPLVGGGAGGGEPAAGNGAGDRPPGDAGGDARSPGGTSGVGGGSGRDGTPAAQGGSGGDGDAGGGDAGGPGGGSAGGDSATGPLTGALQGADGTVGGTAGTVGGTAGTVGSSPGDTVNRLGDTVNGVVGGAADTVEQGTGIKLPAPEVDLQLPDTNLDSPSQGGGGSSGGGVDVDRVVEDTTSRLPVPTPQLPKTGITVPNTGVRLP